MLLLYVYSSVTVSIITLSWTLCVKTTTDHLICIKYLIYLFYYNIIFPNYGTFNFLAENGVGLYPSELMASLQVEKYRCLSLCFKFKNSKNIKKLNKK